MELPRTLPEANEYGTYYIGEDHKRCPAIYRSRFHASSKDRFILSLGLAQGFLLTANDLRYFPSAPEALAELRRLSH